MIKQFLDTNVLFYIVNTKYKLWIVTYNFMSAISDLELDCFLVLPGSMPVGAAISKTPLGELSNCEKKNPNPIQFKWIMITTKYEYRLILLY